MDFSNMTDNMRMLFQNIVASLGVLPEEQRNFIFGEPGDEDIECITAVAQYITLEYIKYSFDYDDPVYPIRHFIGNDAEDCERMLQSRIIKYAIKYKKPQLQ